MQLKIIFDNKSNSEQFAAGWGFSCLIGDSILFDTGEKFESLGKNLAAFNIDTAMIKHVIISHEHWDHVGGLWGILKKGSDLNVFVCPLFSQDFKSKIKEYKGKIIESDKLTSVDDGVFVTGEMEGCYKGQNILEQAVVVNTPKGISVVTGCAHPGIVRILQKVRHQFPSIPFYAVLGGFHLGHETDRQVQEIIKQFKAFGIKKVAPAHCTGEPAMNLFRKEYGNDYIQLGVGEAVDV